MRHPRPGSASPVLRSALAAGLALLLDARVLEACSVCFGDPSSSMSRATRVAIWFLLGVIVSVLGIVVRVAWVWGRRAREQGERPGPCPDCGL